ncbi:hypothetical protein V1524DRAFT_478209 [Lipomyces starkeyi]
MALVQSNNNNSSDNCEQTFTYTSSASTIPGTSTSPPAIAPTSQLTFDALESTAGQHLYEDQQPLMALSSASIGATNEGSMPNNTIGSFIAPPQLPAVGGDLALQNEIFLHNTQMEGVRQNIASIRSYSTSLHCIILTGSNSQCSGQMIPGLTSSSSFSTMKWTNRMFSEANILSTKKTHAGRKAGAQMAEIQGVDESEIRE